ncbi:TolC family protein [Taibaiella chishuiensis]|uniref:Outer membrane protein TolC n=1 Tax=Taibaiella chishuiensis TaxID=1434707 RepID=A0A2P8CZP9_9BACT|nr:TolC family protein [Taibaiella chishuiensis]PSK90396.1 outer membrane protein TolC [Taibaiella chishuiensis]
MKKLTGWALLFTLWLTGSTSPIYAQAQEPAGNDTAQTFSITDLEDLMFQYNPMLKQADLLSTRARMQVQAARGKFDPVLKAGFDRKEFGTTEYYNKWTSELKIPVWLGGTDLKVGYDRMTGEYLNPEHYTGNTGLSAVGINIPLGQGLLIDERRRVLRQAQAMARCAEGARVKEIISVWLSAVQDYWSWYHAWTQYQLVEEGVKLAQTRFDALRNQSYLGDKPAIDTVEAIITLQDRQQQLAKTAVDLANTRLILSNHLWNDQGQPLELPEKARPYSVRDLARPATTVLDSLLTLAVAAHPELVKSRSKQEELQIEQRYRAEMLKPKLNLSGSLLSRRTDFGTTVPGAYDFALRNYKVGIDFALPLFLRAERAKLSETKAKLEAVKLGLQDADRQIRTGIYTAFNALQAYESQLGIQQYSIRNQQALLTAEQQKFDLGESTLFLINSRESKLLDMKMKYIELTANYQKKLAELYYKAGTRWVE